MPHARIQRLAYLAWAASGKDPGFSPAAILEEAGRSARYSAVEVAALSFAGASPDAAVLSRMWRAMLQEARQLVAVLPPAEAGNCVLDEHGDLFSGDTVELQAALTARMLRFHEGQIRGALPQVRGA